VARVSFRGVSLPPWSKPLELDRLADGGVDVEFDVALAELAGLRSLGASGSVRGHARFGRERGFVVAELTFTGSALLECQRCLRPMELPLDVQARVALIASEAEVARVPEDLEPVLAAGGRISIGELITEELLLSLPIVPLHAEECVSAPAPEAEQRHESETHKPFARLAELMKR
jgi:uncharacterized protein